MTLAAYRSVRLVGGVVPADALTRAADLALPGQMPDDYELTPGVAVSAAVARAWNDLLGAWQDRQRRLETLPADAASKVTRDRWLLPLFAQLGYGRVPALPRGLDLPPGLGETTPRHYPVSHQLAWPVGQPQPSAAVAVHLVAETVDLDRRAHGVAARAPHAMVQEFLNASDPHLYALLSNGLTLRLLRDASTLTKQAYVEFDLQLMFNQQLFSDFRLLWLLLHATRLAPRNLMQSDPAEAEAGTSEDEDAEDDSAEAAAPAAGPSPDDCWLETWRTQIVQDGSRARDALEAGVAAAITALGTGFVSHPANEALRQALKDKPELDEDLRRWLLRCVYRFIVLFVAEDRELLHPDDETDNARAARTLYRDYFSSSRIRRLAGSRSGNRHADLWPAHLLVTDALAADGNDQLALPALAESLYGRDRIGLLADSHVSNRHLLAAVRHLSQVKDRVTGKPLSVDYRNLDSEELGGVYEGLLAYVPRYDPAARTFTLAATGGSERKKTGSYYTPTELISLVLDEALDPQIDQASKSADPETALLGLTVCDPACGSGHFLVAAARRIASALAVHRTKDPEPSPTALREAMRDVVARCIYGVDVNDLAIEVAKVALWLEALTPGRPFAFLDHHLKVGNALLGTTPRLVAGNVPDHAFEALDEHDDKTRITQLRKRNKAERQAEEREGAGQLTAFDICTLDLPTVRIAQRARDLDQELADDVTQVRERADAWRRLDADPALVHARLLHDAWCAAFVQPQPKFDPDDPGARLTATGITHAVLRALRRDPGLAPAGVVGDVERAARRHRFFHWHLEFPGVFIVPEPGTADVDLRTGWQGGFSAVIGNPPWEKVQTDDKEFFAAVGRDDIADAKPAARRNRMIQSLAEEDPALAQRYERARRLSAEVAHLAQKSGRYPLTGRGRLNLYALFAETFRTLTHTAGAAGLLTPSGLATDESTSAFFRDASGSRQLRCFYDFVNGKGQGGRGRGRKRSGDAGTANRFFPSVHAMFRFACSVFTGAPVDAARLAFVLRSTSQVDAARVLVPPADVLLMNPNTGTLSPLRSQADADLTLKMYRRHLVLVRDAEGSVREVNPWGVHPWQGFNMTSDSHLFVSKAEADAGQVVGIARKTATGLLLPLYEGKHVYHFDHRFSTSEGAEKPEKPRPLTEAEKARPDFEVRPRYWVHERRVREALAGRADTDWLLGFRDITNASNERTVVVSVMPRTAAGNKIPLLFLDEPLAAPQLLAVLSSLAFDYLARQKMVGTSMNFYLFKQLACPTPDALAAEAPYLATSYAQWLLPFVHELTYTSDSLTGWARDLGDTSRPFVWDEARRAVLRAELDAGMFHLFGYDRSEVEHALDSFRVLRSNEDRTFGEYRTARMVLEAYDRMAAAALSGVGWSSALNPRPGEGARHP